MNYATLHSLMQLVPNQATEIIIKGMDSTEVFFTMPREWDPRVHNQELEGIAVPAPYATPYAKKYGGRRWRIDSRKELPNEERDYTFEVRP